MQIRVEEKLNKRVREASKVFGVDTQQIMKRALVLYLETIQRQVDLKKEFDAWDALSNEALRLTD